MVGPGRKTLSRRGSSYEHGFVGHSHLHAQPSCVLIPVPTQAGAVPLDFGFRTLGALWVPPQVPNVQAITGIGTKSVQTSISGALPLFQRV